MNRTELALLARGIDRHRAETLREKGWTIARLQSASGRKLRSLGLKNHQTEELTRSRRPPIPNDSLIAVLFANRFTCCVCRNGNASIVVHHIRAWARAKSHKPDNLAVICLQCHDKAHTRSDLTLGLTAERLRELKKLWEREVRSLDGQAILDAARINYSAWNYFNHLRLFELSQKLGISLRALSQYGSAASLGFIDRSGHFQRNLRSRYMYEGGYGIQFYAYTKELMDQVLLAIRVNNISDYLDKGTLPHILRSGDFIYVQGAHTFSNDDAPGASGNGAIGKRRANRIEVRYSFDRREATSNSAWSMWLRGRQNAGSLVQIKNQQLRGGRLLIQGTVFGICAALDGLKTRGYELGLYKSGLPRTDFDEDDYPPIPD